MTLLLDLWEGTGRGVDCVESTSGQAAGRYAVIAWIVLSCGGYDRLEPQQSINQSIYI
jgi:hypothetical protein